MKIIDLLNKIANKENLPKKIYYINREFYLKENTYFGDTFTLMHYIQEEDLNEEIEVLEEEKKIPLKINKIIPSQNYVISDSKNNSVDERLEIIRKRLYANELYMLDIANTLNEIIDYLKSKGE